MKKIILTLLCGALLVFSLVSCSGNGGLDTPDTPELENVIDYSILGDPYNTILAFMTNPEDYQGQNIKIDAQSSVIYNFDQNRVERQIMLGIDPTGCCNSSYEIRYKDGNYPVNGSNTTFIGTFTYDGYIELYSWVSDVKNDTEYELDMTTLSAGELEAFIANYNESYSTSDKLGTKIRIFGHLANFNGYPYLLGLNGDGYQTWYIELHDATGSISFPTVSGNIVNPVEVIGTLSFYYEGDELYTCIEVEAVNKVECIFR